MSTTPHELLIEQLEQAEYWSQDTCDNDRHTYSRYVIRGDAVLTQLNPSHVSQSVIHVQLRSIGHGGIGFMSHQRLDIGSMWRLGFELQGFQIATQPIAIQYCEKEDTHNAYATGGQFIIEPSLMMLLGVDSKELLGIQPDPGDALGDVEFLSPEALEG